MAPPTNKPRLADLDPDQVGDAAHASAMGYAERLAMQLGCGLANASVSGVRFSYRVLCHYAQTGNDSGEPIPEHLLDAAQLYCSPADTKTVPAAAAEYEPATEWGLAFAAAFARDRIEQQREVSAQQLAMLASVSAQQVRHLVRAGELSADGEGRGRFTAATARRWLGARGVAGFGR